jgi:hypothetical protein
MGILVKDKSTPALLFQRRGYKAKSHQTLRIKSPPLKKEDLGGFIFHFTAFTSPKKPPPTPEK